MSGIGIIAIVLVAALVATVWFQSARRQAALQGDWRVQGAALDFAQEGFQEPEAPPPAEPADSADPADPEMHDVPAQAESGVGMAAFEGSEYAGFS